MQEGPTKNHATRAVPITKFLVPMLKADIEGREPDHLVFPSHDGGGWLPLGEFRWAFDKAVAAVKLGDLVPQELRHTCASLSISAGANIKVIQKVLGHKTATMTWDRYGHLYPDDLDTVADRLDEAAAVPLRSIPLLRLVAGEGKPS
jgi:integrase